MDKIQSNFRTQNVYRCFITTCLEYSNQKWKMKHKKINLMSYPFISNVIQIQECIKCMYKTRDGGCINRGVIMLCDPMQGWSSDEYQGPVITIKQSSSDRAPEQWAAESRSGLLPLFNLAAIWQLHSPPQHPPPLFFTHPILAALYPIVPNLSQYWIVRCKNLD